jgi:hypothetical protein
VSNVFETCSSTDGFVFNNPVDAAFGAIAEPSKTHSSAVAERQLMRELEDCFRRFIRFLSPSGTRSACHWDRGRLARIFRLVDHKNLDSPSL